MKIGYPATKENSLFTFAMFGVGGTYVGVIRKIYFRIIPLIGPIAIHMNKQINFQLLLLGFKRGEKIGFEKCIGIVLELVRLTQMSSDISNIDINPILNIVQTNDDLASNMKILLDFAKKKYSCDNNVGKKNSKKGK
ncbi:MAG: acetate--CoA ligase family protein [Candidatus Hodarchaeota archaeon]